MDSTRVRFVVVALVVGLFAIGMVAFLNYYKYRSTVAQMAQARVLVVGRGIENSVRASLGLGLQFGDLAMLPDLLRREHSTESLLRGIDVFDSHGKVLYSTAAARVGKPVPASWTRAAAHAKATEWKVEESDGFVAGISLRNNFNLTVGYMALHYPRSYVDEAAARVRHDIVIASLIALGGLALLMPLALGYAFRRVESDFAAARAILAGSQASPAAAIGDAQFAQALQQAGERLQEAEAAIAETAARVEAAR